jgi:hypothetical protein
MKIAALAFALPLAAAFSQVRQTISDVIRGGSKREREIWRDCVSLGSEGI